MYAEEAHAKMVMDEYIRNNALEAAAKLAEAQYQIDSILTDKIAAAIRALKEGEDGDRRG